MREYATAEVVTRKGRTQNKHELCITASGVWSMMKVGDVVVTSLRRPGPGAHYSLVSEVSWKTDELPGA